MKNNAEILEFAKKALHLVRINIPYLAELTHNIELIAVDEISTAGIFASGRLIINPDWFGKLSIKNATFVIAHEIMHLALQTHYRANSEDLSLFNITHDFIINEFLKETFNLSKTPVEGLDWVKEYKGYYSIKDKSAEELMRFIKDALESGKLKNSIFKVHWGIDLLPDKSELNLPFEDRLKDLYFDLALNEMQSGKTYTQLNSDILTEEFEKKLFPELKRGAISKQNEEIKKTVSHVLSSKLITEKIDDFFNSSTIDSSVSAGFSVTYNLIRSLYQPPWEIALQKWLEFTTRSGRTYARPSRRGQSNEYVRAGSKREGHTLHIVVDTSGSMAEMLVKVLSTIASFCENLQIPEVHIIQCDSNVSDDSWYSPSDLLNFEVKGFWGSDMTPGMLRLSADNEVDYALVITDGEILYPQTPMPYEVLWVLTDSVDDFKPPYGTVISID
ncbi:MAG: VWA-like domain-containing protein [Bacteroidia bacterium]